MDPIVKEEVQTRPFSNHPGATMHRAEFASIDHHVELLGQHACRLLLALDQLRLSSDPAMRLAYRKAHDLIGDLGALRITIALMPDDQDRPTALPGLVSGDGVVSVRSSAHAAMWPRAVAGPQ